MPNAKKFYKDQEKYLKIRNAERARYYAKTAIYRPNSWTDYQDKLVLEHNITDTELSALIEHSVRAIQIRRCRLKKIKSSANDTV